MALQILIVDADAGAAAATSAFVTHLLPTASIACESTPDQGWRSAHRTRPDVLLIDPAPYVSTAMLLIQLCQERWSDMHVIVLASAPLSPTRRRQCHADVYIEKPASPARLLDALAGVLKDVKVNAARPAPAK